MSSNSQKNCTPTRFHELAWKTRAKDLVDLLLLLSPEEKQQLIDAARNRAELSCRFHDLRHTACTRMLEARVPLSIVATIMGWSPSTTVRMSRRYGHIGQAAQVEAVRALNGQVRVKTPEVLPAREETNPAHPM